MCLYCQVLKFIADSRSKIDTMAMIWEKAHLLPLAARKLSEIVAVVSTNLHTRTLTREHPFHLEFKPHQHCPGWLGCKMLTYLLNNNIWTTYATETFALFLAKRARFLSRALVLSSFFPVVELTWILLTMTMTTTATMTERLSASSLVRWAQLVSAVSSAALSSLLEFVVVVSWDTGGDWAKLLANLQLN